MKLQPQPLSPAAFAPFGRYANIYEHTDDTAPIHYAADTIAFALGDSAAVGVCTVGPQTAVMAQMERHRRTEEGWIVLSCDCVAALGTPEEDANAAEYRAFLLPRGTMLALKVGVWHFAPFPAGQERAHVLALLPPDTPQNDLEVVELREPIEIEIGL